MAQLNPYADAAVIIPIKSIRPPIFHHCLCVKYAWEDVQIRNDRVDSPGPELEIPLPALPQ